jgi:hypothetical protein
MSNIWKDPHAVDVFANERLRAFSEIKTLANFFVAIPASVWFSKRRVTLRADCQLHLSSSFLVLKFRDAHLFVVLCLPLKVVNRLLVLVVGVSLCFYQRWGHFFEFSF